MWTSEWVLAGAGAALALVALVVHKLFGPGIDPHNPRALLPLTDEEQAFLRDHVAGGQEETGYLVRARPRNQKLRVFYRYWYPKHLEDHSKAKGVVVMLHGINTHSARNSGWAKHLLQRGYVVAGVDHEGLGRTDGRHGYFHDFNHLVEDAIAFIEMTKDKFKGQKLFLKGG